MTTNVLRHVRVAQESRLLASQAPSSLLPPSATRGSVTPASVVQARPPSGESERAAPFPSGSDPASQAVALSPPNPEILTYEAYKQRFAEDWEESRQQARAEGLALGKHEGRLAGEAEYQRCLLALRAALASAQSAQQQAIEELGEIGVEIVYGAVAKILGERLSDRQHAGMAVREVIKRCQDRTRLMIRVAPAELKRLEIERASLLEGLSAGQTEIIADELVELGGCLLDSPAGTLDGRLETQLQRLREVLMQARAKWGDGHE
jgi:flagellar assembly protein FliH